MRKNYSLGTETMLVLLSKKFIAKLMLWTIMLHFKKKKKKHKNINAQEKQTL